MEIVLLIIIGLIAKNFKSILEFLAEQGQQYGSPPIVKNPGGQPNLSKKAPMDFSYEDKYYSEDDYYSTEKNTDKPKAYKVKNSQTEPKNDSSNILEKSTIRENENSYLETNGTIQTNFKEKTKLKEDTDENLINLNDLKKGVIWQEILEPPRARRPYGKIN